jgi:hypothetical protein
LSDRRRGQPSYFHLVDRAIWIALIQINGMPSANERFEYAPLLNCFRPFQFSGGATIWTTVRALLL